MSYYASHCHILCFTLPYSCVNLVFLMYSMGMLSKLMNLTNIHQIITIFMWKERPCDEGLHKVYLFPRNYEKCLLFRSCYCAFSYTMFFRLLNTKCNLTPKDLIVLFRQFRDFSPLLVVSFSNLGNTCSPNNHAPILHNGIVHYSQLGVSLLLMDKLFELKVETPFFSCWWEWI